MRHEQIRQLKVLAESLYFYHVLLFMYMQAFINGFMNQISRIEPINKILAIARMKVVNWFNVGYTEQIGTSRLKTFYKRVRCTELFLI